MSIELTSLQSLINKMGTGALLFAVLGPPMTFVAALPMSQAPLIIFLVCAAFPFVILVVYAVGVLPGMIAGAVYCAIKRIITARWVRLVTAGLLSLGVSFTFLKLLSWVAGSRSILVPFIPESSFRISLAAALAGVLCASILECGSAVNRAAA